MFDHLLDRAADEPAYRQLYRRISAAVLDGTLAIGARLPSARSLASQLGIARGTVEAAYGQLAGEGYIIGRGAAGTFVAAVAVVGRNLPVPAPAIPRAMGSAGGPLPFQMGLPALDRFPRKLWSRLAARQAHVLSTAALLTPDPAGIAPLRHAIARYLAVARGIAVLPEQVIVTAGFQGALGLICRVLEIAGRPVWMEEPGYFLGRDGLAAAGAHIVGVPVDGEGLDVAAGIALAPTARLAMVSPSHHSPLGVALSLPRRLQLLGWAATEGSWIVEDDYDSEFRYVGRPLPPLKSLDRVGRVLYVGTFSKALFPGLRLGYLVAPAELTERLAETAALLAPLPAADSQATLAAFLAEGHFGRHIRRMRQLYARRRAALARELERQFGRERVSLGAGGMHVLLGLDDGVDDVAAVEACELAGLAPSALSRAYAGPAQRHGLLLSFTNLEPAQAPAVVQRLARALSMPARP
ncbi:MAG TPA: PLP-dependent aminotransferase family protein [Aliidongia sp.]|uniref:MocR-like pyridoxine biosynthesis transcription factor PdxR n=1 Tax=Aliidongia sp. TaxID=1914230 RepID=UPI002DDC912C|nr:PLP-dependent aminotransferase family protein [Aliidongia sp.]HEV2677942.1 PLP-dependent aminotransferase family protein [Aliidongia sp.]